MDYEYPIEFVDNYNGECPLLYDEIWTYITDKSVPGVVPYMYEISSYGRCRSHGKREVYLKPVSTWNGYWRYNLRNKDGSCRYHLIHRIVMIEFCCIPNYQNMQVDHWNGKKDDCNIFNLQWVTGSTNIKRAYKNGLKKQKHGEDCSFATITNDQAEQIAQLLIQRLPHREIAERLNIPIYIVDSISCGATWNDVFEKYSLKEYMRKR